MSDSDSNIWGITKTVERCLNDGFANSGTTVTASLFYKFDLSEIPDDGYLLAVVPRTEVHEKASRVHDNSEYDIQIAVMRKVADEAGAVAIADDFFLYVESIKAFFREPQRQDDGIAYKRLSHDPIYSEEHIQKYLQLTSVITLTITRITR